MKKQQKKDTELRLHWYLLKCDVQKNLCHNGCDCKDEEGRQAVNGPSCKCKAEFTRLVFTFQRRLAAQGAELALGVLQVGAASKPGSRSNSELGRALSFLMTLPCLF